MDKGDSSKRLMHTLRSRLHRILISSTGKSSSARLVQTLQYKRVFFSLNNCCIYLMGYHDNYSCTRRISPQIGYELKHTHTHTHKHTHTHTHTQDTTFPRRLTNFLLFAGASLAGSHLKGMRRTPNKLTTSRAWWVRNLQGRENSMRTVRR